MPFRKKNLSGADPQTPEGTADYDRDLSYDGGAYEYSDEEGYDEGENYSQDYDGDYDEEYGAYDDEGYDGEYGEGEYDDGDEYYDDEEAVPGKKPRTLKCTVLYMVVVLALSVGLALLLWLAADDVLALTKPDNVVTVTISEDDALEDVAQNLKDHGLIRYKYLFILYGKFSNAEEKFGSGAFELNQLFDYHALVNGLQPASETRKTVTLTFPEGYSMDQIFSMLEENQVCTVEDLEDTAANYEFELRYLQDLPYGEAGRLEGYLFPDTYDFYVDDDPVRVISKFLNNFDSKVSEEMASAIDSLNQDIRRRMEEEGSFSQEEIENAMMDMHKVVTLASLIEKEAGNDQERSMISSVIYNRLTTRVHELLQVDATVEYALGEHKTELTANDLAIDSPYNTYKYKGLPPGPIANPGLSSLMAAIYPADSEYYFYAVNGTGGHSFFETYMEQQDFLNGVTSEEEEPEEDENEDPDAQETFGGEAAPQTGDAPENTEDGPEEPYYQQTIIGEDGQEAIVNAQ